MVAGNAIARSVPGLLAAGALLLPAATGAATLAGIPIGPGAILQSVELVQGRRGGGLVTAAGEELVGIGRVVLIKSPGDLTRWQPTPGAGELTFHYHGFFAESLVSARVGNTGIDLLTFSGGVVELYFDDTPDYSPDAGLTQADAIATATDGQRLLIGTGSPLFAGGEAATLQMVGLRPGNRGTPFASGAAVSVSALLDLLLAGLPGRPAAAFYFDTDTFGCAGQPQGCTDTADAQVGAALRYSGLQRWAMAGSGTLSAVAQVPLPPALGLLAAGLAGLGLFRRRRS